VTGSLSGFQDVTVTTARTLPVALGEPVSVERPTLRGTARVGGTLEAATGSTTGTVEYQWLRNGAAIEGAVGATYTVAAADLRARLAVRVTVTVPGHVPSEAVSAASAPVGAATLRTLRAPAVKGKARVGRTVRVTAGRWSAPGAKVSRQWLRNGTVIRGATGAKYRIVKADRRAKLKVRITVTAPGHTTVTITKALKGRVKPRR
jgi:hypothetical protein